MPDCARRSVAQPVLAGRRRSRAMPHDTHWVRMIAGSLPVAPAGRVRIGAQPHAFATCGPRHIRSRGPAGRSSGLLSLRGKSPTRRALAATAAGTSEQRNSNRQSQHPVTSGRRCMTAAELAKPRRGRRDEISGGERRAEALADLEMGAVVQHHILRADPRDPVAADQRSSDGFGRSHGQRQLALGRAERGAMDDRPSAGSVARHNCRPRAPSRSGAGAAAADRPGLTGPPHRLQASAAPATIAATSTSDGTRRHSSNPKDPSPSPNARPSPNDNAKAAAECAARRRANRMARLPPSIRHQPRADVDQRPCERLAERLGPARQAGIRCAIDCDRKTERQRQSGEPRRGYRSGDRGDHGAEFTLPVSGPEAAMRR